MTDLLNTSLWLDRLHPLTCYFSIKTGASDKTKVATVLGTEMIGVWRSHTAVTIVLDMII